MGELMELMPLNIAGKILLDLLKVNENQMGGKVSLTWTPLAGMWPLVAEVSTAFPECSVEAIFDGPYGHWGCGSGRMRNGVGEVFDFWPDETWYADGQPAVVRLGVAPDGAPRLVPLDQDHAAAWSRPGEGARAPRLVKAPRPNRALMHATGSWLLAPLPAAGGGDGLET